MTKLPTYDEFMKLTREDRQEHSDARSLVERTAYQELHFASVGLIRSDLHDKMVSQWVFMASRLGAGTPSFAQWRDLSLQERSTIFAATERLSR